MTEPSDIETERTILRRPVLEDFDSYAALWADPAVMRFIGGKGRTREESWVRFLLITGMWQLLGYGLWTVLDRTSQEFLGVAGFHEMKRDITPSFEGMPEAGWILAPTAQGRGLATEMVSAMLAWAQDRPGFEKTVCIIAPENGASLAVARKCGYREKARMTYHGAPTVLLER